MISKKQAKVITNEVNAIVCYSGMVARAIAVGDRSHEEISNFMRWHDEAVKNLNKILDVKYSIAMYKVK